MIDDPTDLNLGPKAPRRPPLAAAWRPRSLRKLIIGVMVAVPLVLLARVYGAGHGDVRPAIVRVHAGAVSGTGFAIRGPDDWAYIATAFHVVDCGCPVTIARSVEVSDDKVYLQAFPETEIVAFNSDDDLAIVRVRNVRAAEFGVLELATKPVKDEAVTSHGFPGGTLLDTHGLLTQEGKVLGLGTFDVIDSRTRQVVRQNAVEGILVSSALEPGYSGGPTINTRGEVVGVNALKDRTRTSHNGAVSVEALRRLLATVQPEGPAPEPTTAEVEALLHRISAEYLTLPIDARLSRVELPYLALSDRPALAKLTSEVRRLYADERLPQTAAKEASLSPRALLGVMVASQPGGALATFRAAPLQAVLAECDKQRVEQPFGAGERDTACAAAAERALGWDLAQLSLGLDGDPGALTVASIDRVDATQPNYRVSVTARGAASSFDVWVRREPSGLRLKLFDDQMRPYGLGTNRPIVPSTVAGRWVRSNGVNPLGDSVSQELRETLTITVQDGFIAAHHVVRGRLRAKRNKLFNCGGGMAAVDGVLEQDFEGKLDASAGVLRRTQQTALGSAYACKIGIGYSLDAALVVRARGDRLVVFRSNGQEFPQEREFVRERDS